MSKKDIYNKDTIPQGASLIGAAMSLLRAYASVNPHYMSPAMSNHLKIALHVTWLIVGVMVVFPVLHGDQNSHALLAEEIRCRQSLLIPYEQHVASVDEQHALRMANTPQEIPPGFQPWWSQWMEGPLWES